MKFASTKIFNEKSCQLILLILWTCFAKSEAVNVDLKCVYINNIEHGYGCVIIGGVYGVDDHVSIGGRHLAGKTNVDVQHVGFHGVSAGKFHNKFFVKFSSIKVVIIPVSNLQRMDQSSLKGANNLKELFVKGNNIASLAAETFINSTNLITVSFQDNAISFVHENAFENLRLLEFLALGKNWISQLRLDTFKDLENLKRVELQSNILETLPEGLFRNNMKLETIQLHNNKLKVLPANLFKKLNNLENLSLDRNYCIDKSYGEGFSELSELNEDIKDCTLSFVLKDNIPELSVLLQDFETNNTNQQCLSDLEDYEMIIRRLNTTIDDMKVAEAKWNSEMLHEKTAKQKCSSELYDIKLNITELNYQVDVLSSSKISQASAIVLKEEEIKNLENKRKNIADSFEMCLKRLANKETRKETTKVDLRFDTD